MGCVYTLFILPFFFRGAWCALYGDQLYGSSTLRLSESDVRVMVHTDNLGCSRFGLVVASHLTTLVKGSPVERFILRFYLLCP